MIKVLIFTAPFGEGHRSATEALAEYFRQSQPVQVAIDVIDYFDTFTPLLSRTSAAMYRGMTTRWPWLWGEFFDITDRLSHQPAARALNFLALEKARTYLRTHRPDIVISTYPICAQVASELKQETHYLAATVVTDFGVHGQWVHPGTDLYFAGAEPVRDQLMQMGIPAARIHVTGIPVRQRFTVLLERTALRQQYQMGQTPVILLSGGGWGMGYIHTLCRHLAALPVRLLVLCGKNAQLLAAIGRLSADYPNLSAYGFVPERINELLTVADLMISKAGGLTVSEALCKGLPMLLYRPIPGQEVFNADYLVNEGAALWARNPADLVAKAAFLAKRPERLQQLRDNAAHLARPQAARLIGDTVLDNWQAQPGHSSAESLYSS